MLDVVYTPLSALLALCHRLFAVPLGPASGTGWALALVALVVTLRAVALPLHLRYARNQLALIRLRPDVERIRRRHRTDPRRQATEIQRLYSTNGVGMFGGLGLALGQSVVFLGLVHVLRSFATAPAGNYALSADDVRSFVGATLAGVPLDATVLGTGAAALVAVPLALVAAVATHLTARVSLARQSNTPLLRTLTLWLFPGAALASAAVLPVALLVYTATNSLCTLALNCLVQWGPLSANGT